MQWSLFDRETAERKNLHHRLTVSVRLEVGRERKGPWEKKIKNPDSFVEHRGHRYTLISYRPLETSFELKPKPLLIFIPLRILE